MLISVINFYYKIFGQKTKIIEKLTNHWKIKNKQFNIKSEDKG